MRHKIILILISLFLEIFSLSANDDEQFVKQLLGISILDDIANKNKCSLLIIVQNTGSDGSLNTCGILHNNLSFTSYKDFHSYFSVQGVRLCNYLKIHTNYTSDIKLKMKMDYVDWNDPRGPISKTAFSMDKNLSLSTNISVDLFNSIPDIYPFIIQTKNINEVNIQIGNGPYVSMQRSGTNGVVWDKKYLSSYGDKVRIMIKKDNGESVIYTQFGNKIEAPRLDIFNLSNYQDYYFDQYDFDWGWYMYYFSTLYEYDNIFNSFIVARYSYGSDTVIESTFDLKNWSTNNVIPWDSGTTETIIPVNTNAMKIFRAHSR